MPMTTPAPSIMDQPQMQLMDMFGKLYRFAEQKQFTATQPVIWQCSDESQGIKKSLFGYVFDCPVFNLGQVGSLADPERLVPASHHGKDLLIIGGSHYGATVQNGTGYIKRISGNSSPCCGMLHRVLEQYLALYRKAQSMIRIERLNAQHCIEIPYKYLHTPKPLTRIELVLQFDKLVDGEALQETSHGKIFPLKQQFIAQHKKGIESLTESSSPIGNLLTKELFTFAGEQDNMLNETEKMLHASLVEFMPEIVSAEFPHRRIADINTWREFHKISAYLTDTFLGSGRNIFLVAGLTLDHSIKKNTFIPQFGFSIDKNDPTEVRYYNPIEITELLESLPNYRPEQTFLQYAEID